MIKPYFKSDDNNFYLLHGDTFELLPQFDFKFDMVFADPPYFLSNGGLTIQNGQIVSVNKGNWDKSLGFEYINEFNRKWLSLVRDKMKEDATIWISGTMHNIFSVGQILTELGFKILNVITWEKTNPPPNFSCRYFTYSTEQIVWARKNEKVPHYFNYELMKELNADKQMKDVWKLPAIQSWEKSCGKHPTQKPLSVLTRLILASTKPNAWILDPFTGSSTTGISANLSNRRFLGIDKESDFLEISKNRKLEINNRSIAETYKTKIAGFIEKKQLSTFLRNEFDDSELTVALGFCRAKEINSLKSKKTFYFHAIEANNNIIDFPTGISESKRLFIYSGGRNKPIQLTGYSAEIESIQLRHKSSITGKEKSKTAYYYEVVLKDKFKLEEGFTFEIDINKLFDKSDKKNRKQFTKSVPVMISFDKLQKSRSDCTCL
ncbi:MAG: site-specific DNA-methyltransferase [Planctomycetaceae bacterium]|jgi:site-specific DNA-methyltransferase (adenine-specific)|nr:site-specific DNA-methyltransferase [Planctomycetaceae bacterium]